MRIPELARVSLHPFLERPLPLWHLLTGMRPCFHGTRGFSPVLCPFQPLHLHTSWPLSERPFLEPGIFLRASCSLWLPCLSYPVPFASTDYTYFIYFFLQDSAQMHLSCEVFSTSSVISSARLDSICTLYISSL